MTGVLDRLERGGWITRERDPHDRRAVLLTVARDRYAELMRRYAPMNRAMNKLLTTYTDAQLETIADFLKRTVEAGRAATDELTATTPS